MIKACDNALKAKDDAIAARDKELGDYAKLTKTQSDEIASAHAFYKSPYLWGVVGLVVGIWAAKK